MKRILAILLAVLTVSAMVSCGFDNKKEKTEENTVSETRVMDAEEFIKIMEISMSPYTHDVSDEETMTSYTSVFNKSVEFHFFEFTDNAAAVQYYEELKGTLAAKEVFSKTVGEHSVCKYEDETNDHIISKVDNTILYGIGKKAKEANLEEWFVGFEYVSEKDAVSMSGSTAE